MKATMSASLIGRLGQALRSQADGRSVTLRLTDKGHEVVARDPFEVLVRAVDSKQSAMHDASAAFSASSRLVDLNGETQEACTRFG